MKHLITFLNDDAGATAMDYALVSCLVWLAALAALTTLDAHQTGKLTEVALTLH